MRLLPPEEQRILLPAAAESDNVTVFLTEADAVPAVDVPQPPVPLAAEIPEKAEEDEQFEGSEVDVSGLPAAPADIEEKTAST